MSLNSPTLVNLQIRSGTSRSEADVLSSCRPASRCGTASRIRSTSATAFCVGDATSVLFQASRLNPNIYAEHQVLVKALFQFLYYHEADVQKALSLCEAVMFARRTKNQSSKPGNQSDEWWWQQQIGRCLSMLRYPSRSEKHLLESLNLFPHPDTYLLLSRLYQRMNAPERSLQLIEKAIERHPFDVHYRLEQGRILDLTDKNSESVQIYRLVAKLNPINIEALACIALNYFYDNNPEMALMYYKLVDENFYDFLL